MAKASIELKNKLKNEYINLVYNIRNIEKHLKDEEFLKLISYEEINMFEKKKLALEQLADIVTDQCLYYGIIIEDELL